jgi:predicted nucleic acid-binding protein
MTVVANSGPLIAFAVIGQFDLLRQVYGGLRIPQAVYDEVVVQGAGQPGAAEVRGANWIQVEAVQDTRRVGQLQIQQGLHAGECEAIVLATEQQADVVLLDDKDARTIAQQAGLKVVGSAGVLVAAKRGGLIPEVRPLLDAMIAQGVRIAPGVRLAALRLAGE